MPGKWKPTFEDLCLEIKANLLKSVCCAQVDPRLCSSVPWREQRGVLDTNHSDPISAVASTRHSCAEILLDESLGGKKLWDNRFQFSVSGKVPAGGICVRETSAPTARITRSTMWWMHCQRRNKPLPDGLCSLREGNREEERCVCQTLSEDLSEGSPDPSVRLGVHDSLPLVSTEAWGAFEANPGTTNRPG